jgi:DNA-binding XRE family transcriptional regulator
MKLPTIKGFKAGRGYTKADWDEVSDSKEAFPDLVATIAPSGHEVHQPDDPHDIDDDAVATDDLRIFRERLAAGQEELVPAEFADRMIDGENLVKVWREYREMTVDQLARRAGISVEQLMQIETDERIATIDEVKGLAAALYIDVDDLT